MKSVSRCVPKEMRKVMKRLEQTPGITFKANGHIQVFYNGQHVESVSSSPKVPQNEAQKIMRVLRRRGVPV